MSDAAAASGALSAEAHAVLRAAARRIAPAAYADDPSIAAFDAAVAVRIEGLSARARVRLDAALRAFDHPLTALLTRGAPARFRALPPERQDAVLRAWQQGRIGAQRTIFESMRRLVLGSWYTVPAAQHAIGYLGPYHLRGPVHAWEGPLPGVTRDDEPVLRGDAAIPAQLDLALSAARPAAGDAGRALRADVCVVGSGAGGAVAAAHLAEAGFDVVLLEEGPHCAPVEMDEDEGRMTARLYAEGGARATDDLALALLQGRTVGGGTTVNWMLMLEPPQHVLHEWEHEHGASLLSAASLGPALARVADDVHARVVPEDAHDPANQVILRGARRLGWRATAARINAKGCIRTGMCGLGCRYHAKQSALAVYVPRALAAGARLLSSVRADRIELREHGGPAPLKRVHATLLERASGAPRGSLTIDAPVVVLAGGAVGTPVLLQRSGLGGGGVGEWLRLHPTTAVAGVYDDVVYQAAGIPQSSVCTEFHDIDDGFGYWIECPPYLPALASVATPGFGAGHARRMQQFTHSAALIVLARDGRDRARSAGRVRALRDGVRIDYRMGEHEWQLVRAGMRSAARLHLAAGARELLTLHGDLPPLHTEADLRHIDAARMQPNRVGLFSAHVNGTCRMGTERRTSGCSPDAERWGTPGLYIADGSILPSAPAVNPQWTIMAAARVVAEHVVERHRHSGV